ncbi:MAG: S8 family peptidase [Eubacterium sp.]|nr:S8 family peptidase [Eubacterium sp.]
MERVRTLVHAQLPHGEGIYGKDSVVAILDTGIALHNDFRGRIVIFKDFVNGRQGLYDDNGHGTHLAGIIGGSGVQSKGKYTGMAPECKFVILKVLDVMGNGDIATVIRAVEWLLKNQKRLNIRFLNISIGMLPQTRRREQAAFVDAIRRLWDAGICVVAASGNNGPAKSSVTVPGTIPELITVGSMDDEEQILLRGSMHLGYSGKGPTAGCVTKPEILAPGTHIVSCSTLGNYVSKSGSSMATAVVSGGLAILGELYPEFSPAEMKLFLYSKLQRRKGKNGWGIFDFSELI